MEHKKTILVGFLLQLQGLAIANCLAQQSVQPEQVIALPGVWAERIGEGGTQYWIFSPYESQLDRLPVVVFVHGWGGMDPYLYGGWILHLVRNGYIVIYPRYQENLFTRMDDMTPNAVASVQHALEYLTTNSPVLPDWDRLAIVGHSMGGFIATNLAADIDLPVPKAVMVIQPADGENRMPRLGKGLALADMAGLSEDTLFLLVTGDADVDAGDRGALKIWSALEHIPITRRMLATIASDHQLSPPLLADHFSPLAVDRSFPADPTVNGAKRNIGLMLLHRRWANRFAPNAMDYDGYWKLFDALLDAAFSDGKVVSLRGFENVASSPE